MSKERRRAPRFSISQMVEISYGREAFVHAAGINVSKTGLLCSTSDYLEPYSEISLLISIPADSSEHEIDCEGVVVRSEERDGRYLTAISFTNLSEADRIFLESNFKEE